jgi:hypothetical protein
VPFDANGWHKGIVVDAPVPEPDMVYVQYVTPGPPDKSGYRTTHVCTFDDLATLVLGWPEDET